jgi:RNA polymerase sigma-70 factor (ECF subfamily)
MKTGADHRNDWQALNARSDEDLSALFLAGQQDSLAVLFDRYSRLVYSIAVRIVKDEAEAEDVVQTVFLDFSRSLESYDSARGTLRVWLLQYAYHRALHRKRHLVANRFYSQVELRDLQRESYTPLASEVMEREQILHRLLAQTSTQRRRILELTYCEGLTANEVAISTGLSVNVVRHELYRALAELRKLSETKNAVRISKTSTVLLANAEANAQSI